MLILNLAKDCPSWTEAEINEISMIFDVFPDSLPCDLAILCRQPCHDVRKMIELDRTIFNLLSYIQDVCIPPPKFF
jgi:hypothetical protein